jgi:hypothetical protein
MLLTARQTSLLQLLEKDPIARLGMPTSRHGPIREHVFFKPIDWNLLEQRKIEPPVKPKIVRIAYYSV